MKAWCIAVAWKAPVRPRTDNGVTQNYNDGVVAIIAVVDTAPPGYQPQPGDPQVKYTLRYEERRLGIQRYYSSLQNQIQLDRVIRVPRVAGITTQDFAVTEDNQAYRIDLVQSVMDVYPPSLDLTLTKIEQGVP